MSQTQIHARALQVAGRIDLKGLERQDAISANPLAFRTPSGGTAVLFRFGAVVFIGLTPVEEEELIRSLGPRLHAPVSERESESATIAIRAEGEDGVALNGRITVTQADPLRLLLIAEALASSVALAVDERRIQTAFERIEPVGLQLLNRKLPARHGGLMEQIGEALLIQQRMASRVDRDDKPDALWDHPEHERFWGRLVEEYDLPQRTRAVGRKLEAIRDTSDTITDLLSTRTSHRLEWYIIALIAFEIALGLYDRFLK